MEVTIQSPVSFTPSAIQELKRIMAAEDFNKDHKLRIGVKGGGCSGMSYLLNFDAANETDESFEVSGVPCIMEKTHGMYLQGMEIDWQGGLNSRGFTFRNPNASATCGCGSSFAV